MGLVSKTVQVHASGKNIKHYQDLGYNIPRKNNDIKGRIDRYTPFIVDVNDIPKGSTDVFVEVECDCCGKHYQRPYAQYYNSMEKYGRIWCADCSRHLSCYKDEISEEERKRQRNYPEYTEFIKRILKRDNYTCQHCGKTHCRLVVHHIESYADNIELRTTDTNGITLCETFHKDYHSIYSNLHSNKKDFEEWNGSLMLANGIVELQSLRKIICVETNEIFDSATQLAKYIGYSITKIKRHCNHESIDKYDGRKKSSYIETIRGLHYQWLDDYSA